MTSGGSLSARAGKTTLTLKFKAQKILDQAIKFEREGVQVFEEEPGQTFVLSLQWASF